MKIQLEEIHPNSESSFHIMVNPNLSDFYFWHFHSAFELVFIEATSGTRHIGEHVAKYYGSDLAFIGSNIPHLNFDYGIKTEYQKIVLHIRPEFFELVNAEIPEFYMIKKLAEHAKRGVVFGENTKKMVASLIKNLPALPYFEQVIEVLKLLNLLGKAKDFELLHEYDIENQYNTKQQERMRRLYQFLDENYLRKISVQEAADLCHMSHGAFCRFFKQMTKLSFIDFVNHYRINFAKSLLNTNSTITEVCFTCGFESVSYFNRTFKKITGKSPSEFKRSLAK